MFAIFLFTPHINSYHTVTHTISRLSFLGNSSNVDIVDFAAGCRMGFVSQVCPFELLRHCGLCAAGRLIVCSRLWAPLQEFLPKAGAFGYDDYNQVFSRFVDYVNIIIFQDMNRSIGISRVRPCIAECWWFSMVFDVFASWGAEGGVQYQRQWKVTRRTIQGFDMPGRWQRPLRKVLVSSRFSRCPKFLDHVAPTCFLPMIFQYISWCK